MLRDIFSYFYIFSEGRIGDREVHDQELIFIEAEKNEVFST